MYKLKSISSTPVEDILTEFASLPPHDNHALDMSVQFLNKRYERAEREVPLILASIPSTVKRLNLSVNFLAAFTGEEFAVLLKAIPATVEILELSGNFLFEYDTAEELVVAFTNISEGIKSLDLSYNGFSRMYGYIELLTATFEERSPKKIVDSREASLAALEQILAHPDLDPGLLARTLGLPLKSITQLKEISEVLEKILASMEQILKALPAHITTLDLRGSDLAYFPPSFLKRLLSKIPPHIKRVHLGENGLDLKTEAERDVFLSVVPQDTFIDIRDAGCSTVLQGKRPAPTLPVLAGAGIVAGSVARPAIVAVSGIASGATSRRSVTLMWSKAGPPGSAAGIPHSPKPPEPARPKTAAVQGLFISTRYMRIGADGKPVEEEVTPPTPPGVRA